MVSTAVGPGGPRAPSTRPNGESLRREPDVTDPTPAPSDPGWSPWAPRTSGRGGSTSSAPRPSAPAFQARPAPSTSPRQGGMPAPWAPSPGTNGGGRPGPPSGPGGLSAAMPPSPPSAYPPLPATAPALAPRY